MILVYYQTLYYIKYQIAGYSIDIQNMSFQGFRITENVINPIKRIDGVYIV